ncbi:MAG TPA: M1 family metallopeptidase [Acidimicrobiales bacterium]|nr:M1 family metallopeptidase [Acidimicrobiales bacterium]
MTDNPHRLPRTARPTRYDLVLEPDLDAAAFRGTVDIAVDVLEPVSELVLNAAELDVRSVSIDGAGECAIDVDEELERLTLTPPSRLEPGAHRVTLEFTGTLNDKLRGWYRSTYKDASGAEQVIATSQMQATDCRRAFPCWDEPEFKAVFAVTLRVREGLLAISNGPEVERHGGGTGTVTIRFADTMPMSTYLVAFVVGPLEATKPVDVDGTPLRVVHVPGKDHLTAYGLEVGAFALRWFEDYYGIPYPSDKVDLVALPDFAAGAMENLGCITFRENVLLVDPATSTQQEEQLVADVVSHELAHMWFGDLVTMRWWNGIWLNEAFATFMEVAACDAFRPAWKRWETFSLDRTAAFEVDSLAATRPVEFEVVSPADADGMFDVLTYEKGGSLLRMLEQYLGEERFREGIRHYLQMHSYGNTETGDLWDAIESVTGDPVRRIMDSWIWQGGFPLVSATLAGDEVVLRQRRFRFSADGAAGDTRWAIPVRIRQVAPDGAAQEERLLLDGESASVRLLADDAVVVVNSGGDGFFRVSYDEQLRARLTAVAQRELSTVERYNLVDDTWAAVVAGATGAASFVELARGFTEETELAVWRTLLAGLGWCDRLLDGAPRQRLQEYVRELVRPALSRLGWAPGPDDDDLTRELRGLLVRAAAVLGQDADAQARARELFEAQLTDPARVDPPLAAAAIAVAAATGGAADFERFVAKARDASNPQEQLRYLYALAEFPDAELFERVLDFALSSDVKTQNAPFLLARCIANRDHGERAWRRVRQNWDHANEAFPNNSIVRMVDPVRFLCRPEQQADVAAFFREHEIPQAAKTLQQVLERQAVNVGMRERESPALAVAFGDAADSA